MPIDYIVDCWRDPPTGTWTATLEAAPAVVTQARSLELLHGRVQEALALTEIGAVSPEALLLRVRA